jgi:hypothetical protein
MPNAMTPPPKIEVTPLRGGRKAMTDFRCICGARWHGGPFPTDVAEKFREQFVDAHGAHTEASSDEDLADLATMNDED